MSNLTINLHLHVGEGADPRVLTLLKELKVNVAKDFESLRTAVNDATNKVAARIDKLLAGIKNTMTDDEVAALKAGFQTEVDRLNTLAQDPVDPVP